MSGRRFWVETLGCPKNAVDSDKVTGRLLADGLTAAASADDADVVVVNTCAFIEEARQESIDVVLALADARRPGAELVVTGCMAERYGDELAASLPEVDRVVGFGGSILGTDAPEHADAHDAEWTPVSIARRAARDAAGLDLLNLPRPAHATPWAYVKVAEGCDRKCGFCAIPSFRGVQRSRTIDSVLEEVDGLATAGVREIVLVAQDLASYGRDQGQGERSLVPLLGKVAAQVDRVRLLYLYPSELNDELLDAVLATGVPYFDLSLQHVSRPLVRRMRRWGDGATFLERIERIRSIEPDATFRSNFIVGYPGETEDDHDELLRFVEEARVDWCGFFAYSAEAGTYAADLDGAVPRSLMDERLAELRELQDAITADSRDALVGQTVSVLVDEAGVGRTHREAPEIDGIVEIPHQATVGSIVELVVVDAQGPDLVAVAPESSS